MGFSIDFPKHVLQAFKRIKGEAKKTPLEYSAALSELTGSCVYLKWENEQLTGSFKFRGALNKLRTLSAEEKGRGVVSASTGNHGLGLSLAAKMEGVKLTLILPFSVSPEKKRRLEGQGAKIVEFKGSCEKAELEARRLAAETGRVYISPYNDEQIVFGQGTIGLEIQRDLPSVEDVVVPVGGGGLVSGIAGYIKAVSKEVRVFGVEPTNSSFMAASLQAGRIVEIEEKETIADAVAGGIEPGSITFPFCRDFLDGIIVVEEPQIIQAMSLLYERHQKPVEGAGALPLAGLMKESRSFQNKNVVLVVSGGNISGDAFGKPMLSKK